jgi:hypothetical protein
MSERTPAWVEDLRRRRVEQAAFRGSYLDGSPTPAWVKDLQRQTAQQKPKPRRDWLATEMEKPWRL